MSLVKLKDEILPAVFTKHGGELVECEFDSKTVGQDQFMSNVVFLTAVVQRDKCTVRLPLVVKLEPFNIELRESLKTNIQFYNEVFMYEIVLPFLDKSNICETIFAKFYHGVGRTDKTDENIVVIEDLRPKGFRLTEERAFLDYEHLSLAMSKLGKFHALSYVAKKKSPDEFYKLGKALKESTWTGGETFHTIIRACFHRPVEYLISQGKHVEVLQRLLKSFDSGINEFMMKLVTPREPLAVICHGDFCRNNVLFAYSEGKPKDVRFFDIATSRYSSPAVDISFFLLLNSSRETRRDRWDDLLAVYHRALAGAVSGAEVPTLEQLRREVIEKAVYGFVHCSFFLPVMAYENPFDDLEMVLNADQDEMARQYALIGGADGTRLLADMVEELIDRGCLTLAHEFILDK